MVGIIAPKPTTQVNESEIGLRFGGGINSRASSDEIDERECAAGENFDLDYGNTQFRPRLQFDLAGTAPNGGRINGFAQLVASDGTVSTLIQAGDTVYSTTNFSSWTWIDQISSSARLRGHRWHNWNLDDIVIVTDLAAVHPVMTWDGSYFDTLPHDLGGTLIAKYCHVDNERVFLANVITGGTATPHVLLASERSDYTNYSNADRPTSALSDSDPFFLPVPDLRPINSMAGTFDVIAISTLRGNVYKITGSSSKDFAMTPFHYDSYADGTESMVFAGNDVVYGRPGRIESLLSTDKFGDIETNDLSLKIANSISTFKAWTLTYSSRHQRVYCSPQDEAELWVLHKPLVETELSPWMKWTTTHSLAFQPTTMWSMLDPSTGLEHVYMGDTSGRIYRLEGTSTGGDGGTTDITAKRTSKLYSGPAHAQIYDCQGSIKYRPITGATDRTLALTFSWQGEYVFSEEINITLQGAEAGPVFGGDIYFDDGSVFGSAFEGRLVRERFVLPGQGNEIQCELELTGNTSFEINEIYFGFKASG